MPKYLAPPIADPLGSVETERMLLRRFRGDDLDDLAAVFAHREVWQFPYGRAFTRAETATFLEAQIDEWDELGFGCWIAVLKSTGGTIGYVGLSVPMFASELLPAVEVGWRFAPDNWGKGLASEGAQAALREGFDTMQLSEICSLPQATNPPSYRVCERLGMHFERVIECAATDRRGPVDARLYTLKATDWRNSNDAL